MADNSNSSNVSACTVFDSYQYVIVAAVSSGSAMVSALCCIFVIGLIFFLKKHIFFTQRLIIYHCLAALVRAIALILRLHRLGYQNDSTSLKVLCAISGFMDELSLWYLLVDFSVITFTLLMTAVFHKNVARLEGLFIVLIFVFPLTFNWIPFINDSYGRSAPWCWIRTMNFDDCTKHEFGFVLRMALWTVPWYIVIAVLISTYLVVIVFVARQKYLFKTNNIVVDHARRALIEHLNEEVCPLIYLPFGLLVFVIFPFINSIYNLLHPGQPLYALWILVAIFSPLQGGYIALIYVLDRGTLGRLTCKNLWARLRSKETVHEYPMQMGGLSDTAGTRSHRSLSGLYNFYLNKLQKGTTRGRESSTQGILEEVLLQPA